MSKIPIHLDVNGVPYDLLVDPARSLADVLRDDLRLTGTKRACNEGECASCAVHVDGTVVNSCLVLAVQAQGTQVTTIEGLTTNGTLDPVQQAFADHFAAQCGYCTPGMIMTAKALLADNPKPTDEEIRQAIRGNLCRCTGYAKIVDAIKAASGQLEVRQYAQAGVEKEVVGKSLPRTDALEKVTGRAPYAYDMRLPGMVYGEILRSPYAFARIGAIDTYEGSAGGAHFSEARFVPSRQCHVCLGPHALVADYDASGRVTLHMSSQSTFFDRFGLEGIFGLPANKLRIVVPYLGGGFGSKSEPHSI